MAHDRRFRFGVQLTHPFPGRTWVETAQEVEALGYSSLLLPDHFGDQLAPLTAMAVAAAATTTLRVGTLVFANDYRHPVTLATETATLDALSGGRVELGLGAGWMTSDYERSGIPHDPPSVRVDRLEEAVEVVRAVMSGQPVVHQGTHYQLDGFVGQPPTHRPGGPPIIIGGGGRRVLSIAARHADIVGVNPNLRAGVVGPEAAHDALPAAVDQKVAWVREAAGDRFDDLELNVLAFVTAVTDDRAGMAADLAEVFGTPADEIVEAPAVLVGTVDEIGEALERRRDRWGFSYYVVQAGAAVQMAPVVQQFTGR